uniref:Exonuclease 1 n=2 Tax=Parascaris univalens TaxID=6257 RepID=A0A915C0N0_PARUN
MGIQNLLPFVKKACRQGCINEFAGHSVAVDVSCLLHRGLFGCADRIAQGIDTDFYVRYVMKYVKLLLAIDCHVILVFDGKPLPAKQETNTARRERRDEHKRKGEQLLSEGKTSEAYDCFKRSTSITREVVESTIQAFQGVDMVDILVAPYESDAQLTFLTKNGMAHAVVTEDSDLIAFGCERIIFKMEASGSCTIYEQSQLPNCLCKALADDFDFTKFRRICILAGCDYLQSGLPGVGLNKAATFMAKTSGSDLERILPRLPRYLNMNNLKIKKEFIADFIRAENTFLYQIVYDPRQRRQRPLNDYPASDGTVEDEDFVGITLNGESEADYSYAGVIMSPTVAMRMALGNHPEDPPICDKFVLSGEVAQWSIWNSNFKSGAERMKVKEDAERMKRNTCGAFTLTTSVRKVRKSALILNTKRENGEVTSILDSSLETTENEGRRSVDLEYDDDFIALKGRKRNEAHQDSVHRTKSIKDFFRSEGGFKSETAAESKLANERSAVNSSLRTTKVSKRSNSASQNWNCDDLLRLYSLDPRTSTSDASPTPSQEILKPQEIGDANRDEVIQINDQESCSVIGGECSGCSTIITDESCVEVERDVVLKRGHPAEEAAMPLSRNGSCSSYFLNRGARTSGLSRRSSNPFKKPKILLDSDVADNQNRKGDESRQENFTTAVPSICSPGNPANAAYRAPGLLRVLSAKENESSS